MSSKTELKYTAFRWLVLGLVSMGSTVFIMDLVDFVVWVVTFFDADASVGGLLLLKVALYYVMVFTIGSAVVKLIFQGTLLEILYKMECKLMIFVSYLTIEISLAFLLPFETFAVVTTISLFPYMLRFLNEDDAFTSDLSVLVTWIERKHIYDYESVTDLVTSIYRKVHSMDFSWLERFAMWFWGLDVDAITDYRLKQYFNTEKGRELYRHYSDYCKLDKILS